MRYLKRQSALVLMGLMLVAGALVSGVAEAQVRGQDPLGGEVPIQTEIIIPGSEPIFDGGLLRGRVGDLANYLSIIYTFLISIVGVVAGVFILVGGFQYMTAGGDSARVTEAKRRIGNALIGFILAMSSYLLLNTINPELVNLTLPKLVKVKTESFYLPFCDDFAKQYGIEMDQITPVGSKGGGGNVCGNAGYYTPPGQEEQAGQETEIAGVKGRTGRLWCIMRGAQGIGADRTDSRRADYGCVDGKIERDGVLFDGGFNYLSICMAVQGLSANDLEKSFAETGRVADLARCTGCVNLEGAVMRDFHNTSGDNGCLAWQNTANNGRPNDASFSYNYKITQGIIQDSRKVDLDGLDVDPTSLEFSGRTDDRSGRMYYCGYSPSKDRCIYVPLNCLKVSSCSGYADNNFSIHYCVDKGKGQYECQGNEKLGTAAFTDTGSAHLLPICTGNPCDAGGVGTSCNVPGLAQAENIPGVSTLRVGVRVMTAGLLGKITCEN